MTDIPLDDWAADHGINQRTAQRWAKEKLIPVKKRTYSRIITKTWKGYMIDKDAPRPDLSR